MFRASRNICSCGPKGSTRDTSSGNSQPSIEDNCSSDLGGGQNSWLCEGDSAATGVLHSGPSFAVWLIRVLTG